MLKIILLSLLFAAPSILFAQNSICSCTPTTNITRQHRTDAKHETHYSNYQLRQDTIAVKYIRKWQKKYTDLTDSIVTNPLNPNSRRKSGTPEDSLYILKGYMWFVSQEENDCDLHIEIGSKTKSSSRIIVEVPQENCDLQKRIKAHLDSLGLFILDVNTSNSEKAHFTKGIPCVVTGLGFYDASHKPNTNHGDKHTKKYSWELHPVKEIRFH